ncbi:hypothetical protein [Haloarchaeobius sp. HME9146]|uniref:hypothetical protein n=1 Tax=Haloarchaeobius sp. HME9146 TaxID=2978732 RepID=UPI0021BF04A9|nr:hypothetical protein [Haloarchaeobius sp. HME9146]MCT9094754.1 hypothetical protein [Haloarchaeobius sp. HME9146]
MAEHQGWVVAEVSDTGDPTAVLEAVTGANPGQVRGQREESRVVFYDDGVATTSVEPALSTVSEHLDRVVIVESFEGGMGETVSRYYEVGDEGLGDPVDELESVSRWFVESHFDYYTARYGVDGGI